MLDDQQCQRNCCNIQAKLKEVKFLPGEKIRVQDRFNREWKKCIMIKQNGHDHI
jgi:hypothetical protein